MNIRSNSQLGINTASRDIESVQSPQSAENPSVLNRICNIGSGIYKKVANVLSSSKDTALPAKVNQPETASVPTYTQVSSGDYTKRSLEYADTLLDLSAPGQQRHAAVLNPGLNRERKDLFAHLSEKPQEESVSDYSQSENDWFKGVDREDVRTYVQEQDARYYTEKAARKSRGLFTNLQLWASELKDRFKQAVVPNYYLKKEAEKLEAQANMSDSTRDANAYVKELDDQYYADIAQRKARGRWNNLKAWVKYYMPNKPASGPAQPQPEPPKRPGFFQKNLRTAAAALGIATAMGSCEGDCGGCDATPGAYNTPVASSGAQRKADASNQRTENRPAPHTAPANSFPKVSSDTEKDKSGIKSAPDSTGTAPKSAKVSKVEEKRYQPNPIVTKKEPARTKRPVQPVKPAPRAEAEQPKPAPAAVSAAETPEQKKNQPELTQAEALLLDGIVSNMKRRVTEMKAVLPKLYGQIVLNKSNMGGSDVVVTVDSPVAENETAVREWIRQAEVMLKRLEGPGTVEKLDLADATEKYILRPTGKKIAEDTESKIAFVKDLSTSETRAAVSTARQSTDDMSDSSKRTAYKSYLDSVDKTVDQYSHDPYTDNLEKIRLMKNLKNNANVAGAGF